MRQTKKVTIDAVDKKKGMTKSELIDALKDMPSGTVPFVVTGWSAQIRSIYWTEVVSDEQPS